MKKTLALTVALAAALVAVLVALPFAMDREHRVLDDRMRTDAPGRFVRLRDGLTHIRVGGPAEGAPLVLVHGFNGPVTTWEHNMAELADAGFRVIAYDLFGRGYSDRPEASYDLDLFVRQLRELLNALGEDRPLRLAGSSFGCIVATEFALRNPGKVERLALIGPAGFPSPADRTAWLLGIPGVSDYLYRVIGDRTMTSLTRRYYVEPELYPEAHAAFAHQLSIRGTKRAALSTLRHSPLRDYREGWERIGKTDVPILLVWGAKDVSFPYENHQRALRYMPQARLVSVKNAAHLPQYEKPGPVNAALAKFFAIEAEDPAP